MHHNNISYLYQYWVPGFSAWISQTQSDSYNTKQYMTCISGTGLVSHLVRILVELLKHHRVIWYKQNDNLLLYTTSRSDSTTNIMIHQHYISTSSQYDVPLSSQNAVPRKIIQCFEILSNTFMPRVGYNWATILHLGTVFYFLTRCRYHYVSVRKAARCHMAVTHSNLESYPVIDSKTGYYHR